MRVLNLILVMMPLTVALGAPEDSVAEFLNSLETVYPASSGQTIEFTEDYVQLPEGLKKGLITQFPGLNIRVAKMKYLHWGMDPVNLMIFQDKESREVVTYLWDIWFDSAPLSFVGGVGFHINISPNPKKAFTSIAHLVAYSMQGSVGTIEESGDRYTTTITNRLERPWRILSYSNGSLTLANPRANDRAQGGAEQPAIAPESKSESKSESKARPR